MWIGFPEIRVFVCGGPYNKDSTMLESILGSCNFGKLPYGEMLVLCVTEETTRHFLVIRLYPCHRKKEQNNSKPQTVRLYTAPQLLMPLGSYHMAKCWCYLRQTRLHDISWLYISIRANAKKKSKTTLNPRPSAFTLHHSY